MPTHSLNAGSEGGRQDVIGRQGVVMKIVRVGLLAGTTALLSGCLLPPAVMIASYVADGVVLLASGKTIPDHALSSVTEQDCALFRFVQGNDICTDIELTDGDIILASGQEPADPEAITVATGTGVIDSVVALPEAPDLPIADDDTAAMVLAQTYLTTLGYEVGGIDGIAGTRTRVATMAYQGNQGATPTGILTYGDLSQLGELIAFAHDSGEPSLALAGKTPVVLVQAHLVYFGYQPGPLDGHIGPATLEALSAYQIDRGLAPHAAVTPALLARMRRDVEATNANVVAEAMAAPVELPADAG